MEGIIDLFMLNKYIYISLSLSVTHLLCHFFGALHRLAEDTSLPKMPTPTATPRGVATPRQDEHSLAGVPMSENAHVGK